jgi:drug/metabolite transporter (DMT)-like permease
MTKAESIWIAYASLLASVVLWASSFIALKIAFRSYDPMVVVFGRMFVATLCVLPFWKYLGRARYRKGDLPYILFMVFCEPCLYFLFEASALVYTSASQAGIISSMLPLMVATGAYLFLREDISKRTIIGFITAIAGACWLSISGEASENAPNPPLGNFLEFVAMLCAAGYIVTLKQLTTRYSPFLLTAIQAVTGSIFYFPVLFLPFVDRPTAFDPTGAAAIVYLGAFVTLGAYGTHNFGVSRVPVSQASAFVNLIPGLTLLMGWWILDDRLNPWQFVAMGLIFAGVFLSQDRQKKSASPQPDSADRSSGKKF